MTLVLTILTILLAAVIIPRSVSAHPPPVVILPAAAAPAAGPGDAPATQAPTTTTTTTTTTPLPTTTATTATPECRTQNNTLIPGLIPGGTKSFGEDCGQCVCSSEGVAVCSHPSCQRKLTCWDSVIRGPYCCPVCPNGCNCKTPQGTLVNKNESIVENGENCTCTCHKYNDTTEGPVTECQPLNPLPSTTNATAAPPVCRHRNGSISALRKPGETWKSADGCQVCKCDPASNKVRCKTKRCRHSHCNYTLPGVCCKGCPKDLKICVIDDSTHTYLRIGEKRTFPNGTSCSCKRDEDGAFWPDCYTPDMTKVMADINSMKDDIKMLDDKLNSDKKYTLSEKRRFRKRLNKLKKNLEAMQTKYNVE